MRKSILLGVSVLALTLASVAGADAASLPDATQKAIAKLKLDPSVMDGLDAELKVPQGMARWRGGGKAIRHSRHLG